MDIGAKVMTALRWTATARFLGQLASWAITILVIRLLTPADYGIMAMAAVVMTFFVLINTLGLDGVLVQRRGLSAQERAQIFAVIVTVNLAFFVLLVASAPWIAEFFNEPRLTAIVRVLAVQFVLLIFGVLPQAQLEREMRFKRRSIVDFVTLLVGSVVTLVLAYAGHGVWALVWGYLATTASRVAGLNLIEPALVVPRFARRGMGALLAFAWPANNDRILRFVFGETDKFIGGRLMGDALLGYYAVASHLATLPINKLTGMINSVALPAFAHVQADPRKVGEFLLKASRLMSVLAFPVFFGVSSVAPELTAVLLGEKWQAVALPLQVLSVVMPLRMLMNLFQPLLWGIGRPGASARNFVVAATVMPLAFLLGAAWGPFGMALAWATAFPVVFVVAAAQTLPLIEVSLGAFLRAVAPPALISGLMYVVVAAARGHVAGQAGEWLHLLQLVLIGAAAYGLLMFFLYRQGLQEVVQVARR